MAVMGQTVCSKEFLKRFKPGITWAVAQCTGEDAVLRPLLERHTGCEVRVYPARYAAHGAGVRGQDCI